MSGGRLKHETDDRRLAGSDAEQFALLDQFDMVVLGPPVSSVSFGAIGLSGRTR
jgi:hypothetical protein